MEYQVDSSFLRQSRGAREGGRELHAPSPGTASLGPGTPIPQAPYTPPSAGSCPVPVLRSLADNRKRLVVLAPASVLSFNTLRKIKVFFFTLCKSESLGSLLGDGRRARARTQLISHQEEQFGGRRASLRGAKREDQRLT